MLARTRQWRTWCAPFAEFERALMRERQREAIALVKQRGAYRGRKK
jgi:DNA invertase Pin-like site-specific DNA recombinase